MSSHLTTMLLVGGAILAVLLTPLRKPAALLIALLIAFGLGWFWPKERQATGTNASPGANVAKPAPPPCTSSF